MFASVPASAPAQDGGEAEKLLGAVEERFTRPKTIRLRFELQVEVRGKAAFALKGTVAVAADDRVSVQADRESFGKKDRMTLTSDGKELRLTDAGAAEAKVKTVPTPKGLSRAFAAILGRVDLFNGITFLRLDDGRVRELKPDALFRVLNVQSGGREKVEGRGARLLTYAVALPGSRPLAVSLWVDPVTRLPLKRVTVFSNGAGSSTVTETYSEIRLNEKLDPRQFGLPK